MRRPDGKTARRQDGESARRGDACVPPSLIPSPDHPSPYHPTPPSSAVPARTTARIPAPRWSRCAMAVPSASTAIPIIPSPGAGSAPRCVRIWIASTLRTGCSIRCAASERRGAASGPASPGMTPSARSRSGGRRSSPSTARRRSSPIPSAARSVCCKVESPVSVSGTGWASAVWSARSAAPRPRPRSR